MENIIVDALIEIPRGSKNKYEVDKENNRIFLDRPLFSSVYYPAEYGYIDETLAADNDPIDILVMTTFPTFPGCYVEARVIGMLEMIDSGEEDVKLLAVCNKDPRFADIKSIDDLSAHSLAEIKEFFDTYKNLQKKVVETGKWLGVEQASEYLEEAKKRYQETKK